MDAYHPSTVFSSIDHAGRYAFANQPAIAHWNLTRLAETLLPLLAETREAAIGAAEEALAGFAPRFETALNAALGRKIGLAELRNGDPALTRARLTARAGTAPDFPLTFRRLADPASGPGPYEPVR